MLSKATLPILVFTIAMASSSLATEKELQARFDLLITNDRDYVFNDQVGGFFKAWQYGLSLGFQIATVNSAEDDVELSVVLRRADPKIVGPYWIGGTDLGRSGYFVWITDGNPVGHTNGYNFTQLQRALSVTLGSPYVLERHELRRPAYSRLRKGSCEEDDW